MPSSTLHLHRHTTTNTAFKPLNRHNPSSSHLLPLPPHITSHMPQTLTSHHLHNNLSPNQCCSAVVRTIAASLSSVWSIIRRFDNPLTYKHFLKSCTIVLGDGVSVGSLREVHVVSGMPAGSSLERLEILDDENYVISFKVVGGDHRLENYRSVTTLHSSADGGSTVIVESYVVDVPVGNTRDETFAFVDTIVKCNLKTLAQIAERNGGLNAVSSGER